MFICFWVLLFIIQSKIVSLIRIDNLVSGVDCFWLLLSLCSILGPKKLTRSGILGYGVDLFQSFSNLLFVIRIFVLVLVQSEA